MSVPLPEPFSPIFRFRQLQNCSHADYVAAIGWRFTDDGSDPWTRRFIGFKTGAVAHVRGAIAVLSEALERSVIPRRDVVLVGAIPSGKTNLMSDHPIAQLGDAVASRLGWAWKPNLVTKQIHRSLHFIEGAAERDAEVYHKYTGRQLAEPARTLIVLDDLTTRGSTINEVIRAVRAANPGLGNMMTLGIVLGKNESRGYARDQGCEIDNSHLAAEWLEFWDAA